MLAPLRLVSFEEDGISLCLAGTRTAILQKIETWATLSPSSGTTLTKCLWLHGIAGSGKTAIARSLATSFREVGWLGAFLPLSYAKSPIRFPQDILKALVYQLCEFDSRIREAVETVLQNPSVLKLPLTTMFEELLVKPLNTIQADEDDIRGGEPIIIILDDVHECAKNSHYKFLSLLSTHPNLPDWLRFIITSRDEQGIIDVLGHSPSVTACFLDTASASNKGDVVTYFKHHCHKIRRKPTLSRFGLKADWPGEDAIKDLSSNADGLFSWAVVARGFLSEAPGSNVNLNQLLAFKGVLSHDDAFTNLYQTILSSVKRWNDDGFVQSFISVVGFVMVAQEPVTPEIIDHLLHSSVAVPTLQILYTFGSVIHASSTQRIRIHPEARAYLTDKKRCGDDAKWYINVHLQQRIVAFACLKAVKEHVTQNHAKIAGLKSRKECEDSFAASPHLPHAYMFWIDYIRRLPISRNGGEHLPPDVVDILDKEKFSDWCRVVGMFWSKHVVVHLVSKLMWWMWVSLSQLISCFVTGAYDAAGQFLFGTKGQYRKHKARDASLRFSVRLH